MAAQVCPREVRLLADGAAQQVLPLSSLLPGGGEADEDLVIRAAEVAGRYVMLRLRDGTAVVLHNVSGGPQIPAMFHRSPRDDPELCILA